MMTKSKATVAACALGAIAFTLPQGPAYGQSPAVAATSTPPKTSNLNINPKRITFDRLGRSAAIYVFNQGGADGAFNVTLVDRLMLPTGEIVPASDASDRPDLKPQADRLKSARELLTVTPRRVTLQANTGQTIRVRASSLSTLPPGEYRTHLTVTGLPPASAGLTAEQAASARPGALSFHIDTVLSLSIPVIVRIGPIDARAAIANPRFSQEDLAPAPGDKPVRTSVLSFDLVRAGASSLFGDIEVRGAKERGDRTPLGAARGVGVYTEIDHRTMRIPLRRAPSAGEAVEIVFRDDDGAPGKVLARATAAPQ